ncbi:prolipoprotein diacylglyceryl transferase family protein [Bosea sp. 2RAB26]|uniref:TlpA family protein disulfide reductase n=1 Tax=Bosea sp. 2RAB26 TaxID=3237476 RepID=UPI003F918558
MNAVSIGPFVFAPDRFAAILAIATLLTAAALLSRRLDARLNAWASSAVLAAIVAARLGHVALHWPGFAAEPWRMLAIWQGGFSIPAGLLGVALVTAIYARSVRFAAGAVGAVLVAGLVGLVTLGLTKATYGQQAPATRMATLDGALRSIGDFEGKPLVVNLWATWCPPCRREMPMLAREAAERADVGFLFVNQGESAEKIRSYLLADRLTLDHVLLDAAMALSRHYAAPGLPVTLFLRRDGTLASLHTGEISREALAAGIEGILAEPR